jgi:uncharacterized GH25 family protein
MEFNWNINQLNRTTADNFVITVHYSVTATDGDYSANTYGTVGYTQEEGENYIPFEQLTPEIVVGWCQESLGKDTVEASLASQIEALKNPTQLSGLPWANTGE